MHDERNKASRAARRREKRANERRAQEQALAKAASSGSNSIRFKELKSIEQRLGERNLRLCEVPSDGDCLYSSVAHQLRIQKRTVQDLLDINGCGSRISEFPNDTITSQTLRLVTAEYVRKNADEFLPFMVAPETGEPLTTDEFFNYCDDIEKPSTWGGQLEVRALANALHTPIEILQAEGPSILIGEEFNDRHPIILVYHRYAFALGEHYNSCTPIFGDG
ncbi:OTU domain-containing protein 6B [Clonorchis sinensis]|nr:OTU domain-containing protein 6B [Clonorchis sinensis]